VLRLLVGTVLLRIVPLRIVPHHRAARGRPVAHSFRRARPILPTGRKVGTRPGRTLVRPANHGLRVGRVPLRRPARARLMPVRNRVLRSPKKAHRPSMRALLRKKSTRDYRLIRGRFHWPVLVSVLAFFLQALLSCGVLTPGAALAALVPCVQGSAVTRPAGNLLLQFFTAAVAPRGYSKEGSGVPRMTADGVEWQIAQNQRGS
jgi:hypothetical protein